MAVLSAAILASIFSTQIVLAGLGEIGVPVGFNLRSSMTIKDLRILETLVPVITICFAIGFLVAYWCQRIAGGKAIVWYAIAGASAFVTTLLLIRWQLDLSPIAGARSLVGLSLQALAGAIGGVIFSISRKPQQGHAQNA